MQCPDCNNNDPDMIEVQTTISVILFTAGPVSLEQAWEFLAADPYDNGQPLAIIKQVHECTECGHEWEVAK